jgi:hypothetical protein
MTETAPAYVLGWLWQHTLKLTVRGPRGDRKLADEPLNEGLGQALLVHTA